MTANPDLPYSRRLMPTYSYKCTECGNAFDIQQAFTDNSLTECPVCSGQLRKVFGAVGVSFTGSGFYRNDSREGANKSAAAREKKDAAPVAASSSSSEGSASGSGSSTASSSASTSGSSTSGSGGSGSGAASSAASKKPAPAAS
jgi:putative FmdB family regulatory protein